MYRIGQEEIDAVAEVIRSKKIFKTDTRTFMNRKVEDKLKTLTGAAYAINLTSGFAALVSGLIGLGIGPGDEVIIPAYTYIATAMAVIKVGAIPVLADIDETLTLDPKDAEAKITSHTKAILPVHMRGLPCRMDEICAIAKKHGLLVMEDACQADGGSYQGKKLGAWGDAGAFSFNYYKIISAGEGGAVLTSDKKVFERALIYHDSNGICYFGDQIDSLEEIPFCGDEYRSNEITSAVISVQLDRLDGILTELRRCKALFNEILSSKYRLNPSNDAAGDCGTTVTLLFDTKEEAAAFRNRMRGNIPFSVETPINTGKHVYTNWPFITNRRGAAHPAMDPFLFEANKGLAQERYSAELCPKTLDILARTVYIHTKADASEEMIREAAEKCF